MDIFKHDVNDSLLTHNIKRDYELAISNIQNKGEIVYKNKEIVDDIYRQLINASKGFDNDINKDMFKHIMNLLSETFEYCTTRPISLRDEDFKENAHIIAPYIIKNGSFIINTKAYKTINRTYYSHNDKKELNYGDGIMKRFKSVKEEDKIYISKGGVITGEYISDARIDYLEEIINNYTIPKTITIPVSTIFAEKDDIVKAYLVVDHREPMFKKLFSCYKMKILIDENVKQLKLNLRNYEKINKK